MQKVVSLSLLSLSLLAMPLLITACSQQQTHSVQKDLSHAFPADGQDRLVYFSTETATYEFAQCKPNQIAVRKNCSVDKSFSEEALVAAVRLGYEEQILRLRKDLAATISQSFTNHPAVSTLVAQGQAIDKERADLLTEKVSLEAKSQIIRDQMKLRETEVLQYREQLAQIDAHLSSPSPESFMVDQRATLERELSIIEQNQAEAQGDLVRVAAEIEAILQKLNVRDLRTEALNTAMIEVMEKSKLSNESIDALNGKIVGIKALDAHLPQVLDYAKRQDLTVRSQFLTDKVHRIASDLFTNPKLWTTKVDVGFTDAKDLLEVEQPWNFAKENGVEFIRIGNGVDYLPNLQQSFYIKPVPVSPGQTVKVHITSRIESEAVYDRGQIQYFTDDGVWTHFAEFEGVDFNWSTKTFTLTAPQSGKLYLRVAFASDGGTALRGWDIDSIQIVAE